MQLERSKNAIRNMAYGLINKAVLIIGPFLVRTVFIKVLGAEYLGLNSLFTSILTVLNLTELGFSSAIVFSLYEPIAKNDYYVINALLLYYKKIYRIIGCIILVMGVLLIPFLPVFIEGGYPADINITWVYLICLINTAISYFMYAYWSSLIAAYQRNDLLSKVNTVISVLMYIVQLLVLLLTKSYYSYILLMPIFTVVNNVRTAVVAKKMFPEISPQGKISDELRSCIKEKVVGLMINKISGVSRNAFDSIFISMFLGLFETAVYNNYYYIMNAVFSIMLLINSSLEAGVGNRIHTATVEENYRDMNRMNFLYMWIAGWCTICLVCLYQPFMKIWMGNNMLMPFSAMVLLCLYFYVLNMGNIRSIYVQVTGLWWEHRYRAIAEALLNIILNYILGEKFGLHGIILATLLTLFFVNFCYGSSVIFKYYFGKSKLKEYFKYNLLYGSVTIFSAIVMIKICDALNGGIGTFVIKMALCAIIPNVLYFIAYHRCEIFKTTMVWLRPKLNVIYNTRK